MFPDMTKSFIAAMAVAVAFSPSVQAAAPDNDKELFNLNKVWSAHLSFTEEQWKAIEPKRTGGGFGGFGGFGGGRPGGGGGFGGPGGPGGRGPGGPGGFGGPGGPGGPGGFNPAGMLAGGFVRGLDADKDGSLTKAEFVNGFAGWFKSWDTNKTGSISSEQLTEGLNKELNPFGGGGGPGGRPGGGGPGGMNLTARDGARNGLASMMGIEFQTVHADLDFEGRRLTNIAVRYKGNGTYMNSQQSDKKSFKLDLNEFVKGQKLGHVSKLNFHNNVTDASWMNEPLGHALYRDAGVPAPRSTYLRLKVTAPPEHKGDYFGLYSIVENPDSSWAQHNFKTKDGLILKPVTRALFDYQGDDWAAYNQAYDPKTEITEKQKKRVIEFAKLVTQADDADFAKRLPEYLDIDEFSRYMAVTVWISTMDSILAIGQNFYVYLHPKTDKFMFVPWDLDHAFGNFPLQGTQEEREQLSIDHPWVGDNRFIERVMMTEVFRKAYRERLAEFQKTIFTPERLAAKVDAAAATIRDAVREEDKGKLERFEKVVAGQAFQGNPMGGGPGGPGGGFGGFGSPIKPIKGFAKVRHENVAKQLAGTAQGLMIEPMGMRGGRMQFGLGNAISGELFKQADKNSDGKLTADEFAAVAAVWFKEFDKEGSGKVSTEQLTTALGAKMPRPPFGGPPPGQ